MSVTFDNVYKSLRHKNKSTSVFQAASVEFSNEKINGILAHQGSGKTTATQMTTGKIRPDKGRVRRTSLVSFPVASGGVFNGLLTGRENLAFLCRVFGFDPRPIIRFVIDFTEIGKSIDKPLKHYTRDEKAKLMFASCYAIPFETFLIDDALFGGRGAFREKCEELVRERMKTSGFVIFSSSPSLLRKYCNQFYVIDQQTIKSVGSVDEGLSLIGDVQPGGTLEADPETSDGGEDVGDMGMF